MTAPLPIQSPPCLFFPSLRLPFAFLHKNHIFSGAISPLHGREEGPPYHKWVVEGGKEKRTVNMEKKDMEENREREGEMEQKSFWFKRNVSPTSRLRALPEMR